MRTAIARALSAFVALLLAAGTSGAEARPPFRKVIVVIFENADYADVLKEPAFASLAYQGALLTRFSAETHPSQPNYLALVSGDTQGVTSDDVTDVDGRQLGDLLEARGRTWKAYLENYPGGCFGGERAGDYVRKHNPFISFREVRNSPERCSHLVTASELQRDVSQGTLPDFSFYVPNIKNDAHDTNVHYAGRWFERYFLPALTRGSDGDRPLAERLPKDTLLVVTFDESGGKDNRIFTALVGKGVRPGARSEASYNHYNLLRTFETSLGLGNLGKKDKDAKAIDDIWG